MSVTYTLHSSAVMYLYISSELPCTIWLFLSRGKLKIVKYYSRSTLKIDVIECLS